jgi:hypothetical protein
MDLGVGLKRQWKPAAMGGCIVKEADPGNPDGILTACETLWVLTHQENTYESIRT